MLLLLLSLMYPTIIKTIQLNNIPFYFYFQLNSNVPYKSLFAGGCRKVFSTKQPEHGIQTVPVYGQLNETDFQGVDAHHKIGS